MSSIVLNTYFKKAKAITRGTNDTTIIQGSTLFVSPLPPITRAKFVGDLKKASRPIDPDGQEWSNRAKRAMRNLEKRDK